MAIPTSLSSIKINNNIIDIGLFSTGSTPVTYTYDSSMSLNGSATVTGNTISGCVGGSSGSTNLVSIDSCSCVIQNNNFIRGVGSPLNAYINISGTNDQVITNNMFDQATVDGSSDTHVKGLSANSIYQFNKNQIIYVPISMAGGLFITDPTNIDIVSDASSSISTTANYLSVFINTTAARSFFVNFNLNSTLPDSVRLLEVKGGIFNVVVGAGTLTSGTFAIDITVQDVVTANYTSGVNSILDPQNRLGSILDSASASLNLATNFASLQANSMYITADCTAATTPNSFVNTKDRCMTAQVFITNDINSLGAGQQWYISPLVAKCTW